MPPLGLVWRPAAAGGGGGGVAALVVGLVVMGLARVQLPAPS